MHRTRVGPTCPRAVLAVVVAALVTLTACSAASGGAASRRPVGPTPPAPAIASSAAADPTSPTAGAPDATPATADPAQVRTAATQHITRLSTGRPRVSVAAVNTVTGASYSFGATSGLWTASVYKLLVLETLVLQHQRAGTTLSDAEAAAATTMIENSDDAAGYRLFLDLGSTPGLRTGIRRLGLTHTVPGVSDPTFTTTSATDCVVLLRNLVSVTGPLDARSRAYILGLMRGVEADQRWGVGVVADRGTTFANKNGWLSVDNSNGPGETDDGRWITNSVGIVTVHHQQVLISVLTEHNPDFRSGVDLVEAIAEATVPTVATGG